MRSPPLSGTIADSVFPDRVNGSSTKAWSSPKLCVTEPVLISVIRAIFAPSSTSTDRGDPGVITVGAAVMTGRSASPPFAENR